ncbi:MAG: toll/interleukin-1 receptor domain-containing protein [Clostridia bacterium]|nr:toll/interleukin-1 receptor domain-containing protein [Clostridia bacterium]
MYKVFISHSAKDNSEVRDFINLLVLGMNIQKEDIFSISLHENLPTGRMFSEKIKDAMISSEKIICFITQNYLQSRFCMAELGAAWIQDQKIIPVLFSPITYDDLNNTPIIGTQMCYGDKKEGLMAIHDEFFNNGITKTINSNEFSRYLDLYIDSLKKTTLIEKDDDGFYTVKIADVRNVPHDFKCYKIQGLLNLDEKLLSGETHWIFYRTGMYEELKIGDIIRFKVSQTEIRQFRDLTNARNIYPDTLEVL